MKARLALLALAVAALACGATYVAGRLAHGHPDELRMALLWALPGALFLCGLFTFGRAPRSGAPAANRGETNARRIVSTLPWIAVALALDFAAIGVGYLAHRLTFTYGDQTLAATRATTALWALPLLVLVSIRFWERTLRGLFFSGALATFGRTAAWGLALALGALLALPALAPGFVPLETPYFLAGLATALAREALSIVLFLEGGVVAAGLYRGLFTYFEGYVLNDWLSPVFPSANYVTSSDDFHLVRALGPLLALALLVLLRRRRARDPARRLTVRAIDAAGGAP